MNRQPIAAIILAAGQSRRMGRPKLLLPWGKLTVLEQVVTIFSEAGLGEIVVVTGAQRGKIEGLVAGWEGKYPVRCVHNPTHKAGEMLSSLQCGLRTLGSQPEAALIGLGDQPQVQAQTVRSILAAFQRSGSPIIIPSYQMRRGHPWLVRKNRWDEIRALKVPQTPRDFMNARADEIEYVSVDTPTVIEDLDTPQDYKRHLT